MLQKHPNTAVPSPCWSSLCKPRSVPLRGRPTREHRGQRRPGQLEKLHLLLQAGQSCLSPPPHPPPLKHLRITPAPARPVWPGMQSSDQAASLAHPQAVGVRKDREEEEMGFGKVSGPSARHSSCILVVETHKWKNVLHLFPLRSRNQVKPKVLIDC